MWLEVFQICLACDKTKIIILEPVSRAVVAVKNHVATSYLLEITCNHYFIFFHWRIALGWGRKRRCNRGRGRAKRDYHLLRL